MSKKKEAQDLGRIADALERIANELELSPQREFILVPYSDKKYEPAYPPYNPYIAPTYPGWPTITWSDTTDALLTEVTSTQSQENEICYQIR